MNEAITFEVIHKKVCEILYIDYMESLTKARDREIVEARQLTMYIMKNIFFKQLGMPSLALIGGSFAAFKNYLGKNHATVLHGIKHIQELIDTGQYLYEKNMTPADVINRVKEAMYIKMNPIIAYSDSETLVRLAFGV
jgi:chromosomal replication initiation ATPase DnaA